MNDYVDYYIAVSHLQPFDLGIQYTVYKICKNVKSVTNGIKIWFGYLY